MPCYQAQPALSGHLAAPWVICSRPLGAYRSKVVYNQSLCVGLRFTRMYQDLLLIPALQDRRAPSSSLKLSVHTPQPLLIPYSCRCPTHRSEPAPKAFPVGYFLHPDGHSEALVPRDDRNSFLQTALTISQVPSGSGGQSVEGVVF